jgi:1-acyl-sn-glycerol-3-phosphate acyltransferase
MANAAAFAALILGMFLIALCARVVHCLRGPEDTGFVAGMRAINLAYTRLVHRLARLGCDPLPCSGGCIVVANHQSGADPLLVAAVTRRWIRFLTAREYYDTRGLRWLFRRLECIPVDRDGNDLGATRAALRALHAGRVIGVFPQGGIREADDSLGIGKAGVALLALRTGAPVVPLFIDGSPPGDEVLKALLSRSRARVLAGPPLRFGAPQRKPKREDLERVTDQILKSIVELKASAKR